MTILGIVAAVVMSRISCVPIPAKRNACYVNKGNIEMQTQVWYRIKGTWPANDLSNIGADAFYFPAGLPVCPVDGTPYTLDPSTHRVTGHAH